MTVSKTNDDEENENSGVTFEVVEGDLEAGVKVPRRGVYLLPNLFTTAALFSGFYAIVAAMNGQFEYGAIAIYVAGVLDGLDGRVARMTHTQSAFGAQYDSLSDVVAFGAAPALVMYSWSLSSLGKVGWMVCFIFLACAALRLARFNVQLETTDNRFFTGLSSPIAASVLAGSVWVGSDMGLTGNQVSYLVAAMTLAVAGLMVSNIRYQSFKNIGIKERVPFMTIVLVILAFAVVFIDPPKVLLVIGAVYALSGPVAMIWRRS